MTQITENLFTPKEAAAYCRVTKQVILKAFKGKNLAGAQLNKRVIRFSRLQLDRWLQGNHQKEANGHSKL